MRISDWSSDVCSSDLVEVGQHHVEQHEVGVDLADQGQGLPPGLGHVHLVAEVTQRRVEQERDVVLVVDDDDASGAFGGHGSSWPPAWHRNLGSTCEPAEDKTGRASGRERVCQYV